jgi:hypothetical protein
MMMIIIIYNNKVLYIILIATTLEILKFSNFNSIKYWIMKLNIIIVF